MAAKDVGIEPAPKRPRLSAVDTERSDLRQRLESSFPLDAFLRELHAKNVLTDYEFEQLCPTPQSDVVDRNRKFLDYLANKDPSAVSDTLSVLSSHKYEAFGEMLRQLFGAEGGGEGIRRRTRCKPKQRKRKQQGKRGRGVQEVNKLRSSHTYVACCTPDWPWCMMHWTDCGWDSSLVLEATIAWGSGALVCLSTYLTYACT